VAAGSRLEFARAWDQWGVTSCPRAKANTGTGRRTFEQLDRACGDVDDLRTRAARRGICCAVARDGSGEVV